MQTKYIKIALSIETMLDLSTLTIEDVTGRVVGGGQAPGVGDSNDE